MQRFIWVYGAIGGLIVIVCALAALVSGSDHGAAGLILGYLAMVLGLSMIVVGVKRYRDRVQGGVIGFWRALGIGLGIAGVASLIYVLGWEVYLWSTDYSFMAEYTRSVLAAKQAEGASAAEIAKLTQDMAAMATAYRNPLVRLPMTFSEIAPVGIVIAVVSAALLRNSRFLPARG